MSLFQQQRNQVGRMLMDASIELFRKNGYEETTIDEITKTVGIAKGTFYNFFGSKRDVLMKWAVQVFQKLDFHQAFVRDRTFQQNMEVIIDLMVKDIISEEVLFIRFLKELATNHGSSEEKEQFDFGSIIAMIAENSSDYEKIRNTKKDLKINILNDSLYMGIIRWFNLGKSVGGLNLYLKDIVQICLSGITSSKEC